MPQAKTYIQAAEARRRPFPYFISEEILNPTTSDDLLHWLETGVPWRLHQGAFFEQYECDLLRVRPPSTCAALFAEKGLSTLKRNMEVLLEDELDDRIQVVAHKLRPSQGIGIHNDEPHDDLETHRLIIQLNRGWCDENGGHLFFFNSKNPLDIHSVVRPSHNTGIGFAMSERSYHAVSDVRQGVRYSVVYSFWRKRSRRLYAQSDESSIPLESSPGGVMDFDPSDALKPMLRFLRSTGTHKIAHSGRNLLDHLTNTYKILRRWGCSKSVSLAGLFHSVYGTDAFEHATCTFEQRELVRDQIGTEAEGLAYLYCVSTRRSLHENLEHAAPYRLQSLRDGQTIPISRDCLADLATLDLANSIEQLTHTPLTKNMLETDRRIYQKAIPLLPGAAIVEMHWIYQNRNVTPDELSLQARLARLDPGAQMRIERKLRELLLAEQARS